MFTIGGVQKTSLIDFPSKIAAVIFTQGCNFRCGYCHNPELLEFQNNSTYKTDEVLDFLKQRKGKLDGVVITGGEPTLQTGLFDFIKKLKKTGYAVKLDTNGTNPELLKSLTDNNLLDYIAMDIKSPPEKYNTITGVNVNAEAILNSIKLIINSNVESEFRTTVIKSQLDYDDFDKIGKLLIGAKRYYLQKFVPAKVYNNAFLKESTYTDEELSEIVLQLKKYIQIVDFR